MSFASGTPGEQPCALARRPTEIICSPRQCARTALGARQRVCTATSRLARATLLPVRRAPDRARLSLPLPLPMASLPNGARPLAGGGPVGRVVVVAPPLLRNVRRAICLIESSRGGQHEHDDSPPPGRPHFGQ